jgi:hypothetical protein
MGISVIGGGYSTALRPEAEEKGTFHLGEMFHTD